MIQIGFHCLAHRFTFVRRRVTFFSAQQILCNFPAQQNSVQFITNLSSSLLSLLLHHLRWSYIFIYNKNDNNHHHRHYYRLLLCVFVYIPPTNSPDSLALGMASLIVTHDTCIFFSFTLRREILNSLLSTEFSSSSSIFASREIHPHNWQPLDRMNRNFTVARTFIRSAECHLSASDASISVRFSGG